MSFPTPFPTPTISNNFLRETTHSTHNACSSTSWSGKTVLQWCVSGCCSISTQLLGGSTHTFRVAGHMTLTCWMICSALSGEEDKDCTGAGSSPAADAYWRVQPVSGHSPYPAGEAASHDEGQPGCCSHGSIWPTQPGLPRA